MMENFCELTPKGASKTARYRWKTKDSPGTFMMIDKRELKIDRTNYQRDYKDEKLLSIARNWSWISCGTIIVADRGREGLFVIDGQHRALSALRRDDINELPCMVFATESYKEEAQGFLTIQTRRKAVTMIEKFKALLAIDDPCAITLAALINDSNLTIKAGGTPRSVACLSALMDCVAADEVVLKRIWPVLAELSQESQMHQRLVLGLFYIEQRLPEGFSIANKDVRTRLLQIGAASLVAAANAAAAYHGSGSAKIWAEGILNKFNFGKRIKLALDGAGA